MAINTKASHGSSPQHYQPIEGRGIKALFHSEREIALIIDKVVRPGFGRIEIGTVMSLTTEGSLVPYPSTDPASVNAARAMVLANLAAGDDTLMVSIADSYKFMVGDDLFLQNTDGGGVTHDGGAIISIDRTNPGFAVITFTDAIGVGVVTFTVANGTSAYIGTAAVGAAGMAAFCIIDKTIDTGLGPQAAGAWTSVVLSNAVLNRSAIPNIDAAALVNLGGVFDSNRFVILR